jgi:hypothetical protein
MIMDIKNHTISIEELGKKLEQALPAYHYKERGTSVLIAKKSAIIGVIIMRKKKRIQVSGNFPEFYMSLIFAVITLFLGIFVPVLLYFIFIHGKMKKAEKEIAGCLQAEFDNIS